MSDKAYRDNLSREFGEIIDGLNLNDQQKRFLTSRWLEQLFWMEGKAGTGQFWYYRIRLVIIIGGVIVPALVGIKVTSDCVAEYLQWVTFTISLIVAISAAVEGFFRFGERWRSYRRSAELLKHEGWQFFQLSGPYRSFADHAAAYPGFAERIEVIIQSDVDNYLAKIAAEPKQDGRGEGGEGGGKTGRPASGQQEATRS